MHVTNPRIRAAASLRAACLLLLAGGAGSYAQQSSITLTRVVGGLQNPTDVQHAGDGSGRLFIAQQNGIVRILKNGALTPQPFLDIRSRTVGRGEQGLLGLAFPPDFSRKAYFYVNYTNGSGDTVIARYRATADPDRADPAAETVILTIRQPFSNHNGGQIRFGPDGYLYIGTGDGGSGGDPMNNAQNGRTLLGKMLRIDAETSLDAYQVPSSNPFTGNPDFLPEIWSYGLRNPWRFSFDAATGDLWIADVGQNRAEEVNFQPASSPGGENYGWRLMEGMRCFVPGCDPSGLTLPVAEYGRDLGCSVTGGFVYRGARSPGLRGTYLYGDYCSGNIWGVTRAGDAWRNELLASGGLVISTFGEDENRELYVADYSGGVLYRIESTAGPALTPDAIVNAASFVPGIVPGSAATIFLAGLLDSPGIVAADSFPLPTSLAGVSVTVGGAAAPLYSLANVDGIEQVSFQAPFEVQGLSRVSIAVARGGSTTPSVEVNVLERQPGVFTSDGTSAIVVRLDNTLVTEERPLRRGELAYFYATGLGPVENSPGTGNAASFNVLSPAATPVEALLGGIPCDVLFTGLAPGLAGVFQVNIRAPADAPAGRIQLILRQGSAAGPPATVPFE
ncbi:MAG: PQQ-dependent sugar dehydrogenase [Bryobacteraceae bacterium]|nr:PQQ-dependent sugar dehydrogenase [Bryobacteraceae bacterium]